MGLIYIHLIHILTDMLVTSLEWIKIPKRTSLGSTNKVLNTTPRLRENTRVTQGLINRILYDENACQNGLLSRRLNALNYKSVSNGRKYKGLKRVP